MRAGPQRRAHHRVREAARRPALPHVAVLRVWPGYHASFYSALLLPTMPQPSCPGLAGCGCSGCGGAKGAAARASRQRGDVDSWGWAAVAAATCTSVHCRPQRSQAQLPPCGSLCVQAALAGQALAGHCRCCGQRGGGTSTATAVCRGGCAGSCRALGFTGLRLVHSRQCSKQHQAFARGGRRAPMGRPRRRRVDGGAARPGTPCHGIMERCVKGSVRF